MPKVNLTTDEMGWIVSALQSWGDQLAEMASNDALRKNPDDEQQRQWAERSGHDVERLERRMQALYFGSKARDDLHTLRDPRRNMEAMFHALGEYRSLTV